MADVIQQFSRRFSVYLHRYTLVIARRFEISNNRRPLSSLACFFLSLYIVATGVLHEKCLLPVAEGNCSESIQRWFYNNKTGLCQAFVYRGCNGNANNFNSTAYCYHACNVSAGARLFTNVSLNAVVPSSICVEPRSVSGRSAGYSQRLPVEGCSLQEGDQLHAYFYKLITRAKEPRCVEIDAVCLRTRNSINSLMSFHSRKSISASKKVDLEHQLSSLVRTIL